jgi:nanoRNase/pAp phosphatase (c-di-AMP/oligoRNAs hydrolase)
MAILFRELADGTRVSIRADAGDEAVELARRFGGGGHAHRAGFIVDEPLAAVRASVLVAAAAVLRRPS